mmetsp:Transcript_147069/g.256631  ORF Transcript_147069/g.256631 Transcript_147069/m.256631 type:complete len:662 (+) Transcript_147069:102-2087(+)
MSINMRMMMRVMAVLSMIAWNSLALVSKSRTGVRVSIVDGHLEQKHPSTFKRSANLDEVGTGPGRPLFSLNAPALLDVAPKKGFFGTRCIALVMDKRTHALTVNPNSLDPSGLASACWTNGANQTGWSSLEVMTAESDKVPLSVKAYGGGLLEGLITYGKIKTFSRTVRELLQKDVPDFKAKGLVERAIKVALLSWEDLAGGDASVVPVDDISRQAWCALLQMRGIRDGYNVMATQLNERKISMYELMVINMHSELPALVELYGKPDLAKYTKKSPSSFLHKGSKRTTATRNNSDPISTQFGRWASHKPHGAALVRRIGAQGTVTDIVVAHSAFGNYGEMHRVHKSYGFHWTNLVPNMTMTSYPGCISSTDDFFMTDRGLLLMSTNMGVPKTGKFSKPRLSNEGLPSFVRSLISTRLAILPRSWARIYGFLSGIAGAKQWIIVDYNKFKKRQPIANETVFMVEALPSLMRTADVSAAVHEYGFFQAHGVPHFKQIREIFGLPRMPESIRQEHKMSALLDKGESVNSLDNARTLFQEITPSRPGQIPVASRYDIAEDGTDLGCNTSSSACIPEGSIDAKITNSCLVAMMASQARSGPPTNNRHAPFSWEGKFSDWPHYKQPQTWNFPWVNLLKDRVSAPLDNLITVCNDENEEAEVTKEGED